MHALRSRRGSARRQDGFTMVAAIGVLLAAMALSVTAFAAANGDIRFASTNHDQREAYSAAEAGVADFLFRLSRDPDFWGRCDTAAAPAKISQAWNGVGADPRKWRALEGTRASYAIETLPAKGYTSCDPAAPLSMMDPDTGTFSIRATGRVVSGGKPIKRSVIATFKRKNFLDFIYFTDLESQDPVLWEKLIGCTGTTPNSEITPPCAQIRTGDPTIGAWGAQQCSKYWRDGRGNADYPGRVRWTSSGSYTSYPVGCTEIVFAAGEFIAGPFHTNDSMNISNNGGSPTFGRRKSDIVEVSAGKTQEPYRPSGASLNMLGTWAPGAPKLDPPPSNASLKKDATLVYEGPTRIVLNSAGTMTVTNKNVTTTISQPTSGVIYVGTSGACTPYDPFVPRVATGTVTGGCGDLAISGVYTKNLTFAADNDLVIADDLTKAAAPNDSVLGLIANNFVRVAHPSVFDASNGNAAWSNGLGGSARRMGPECRTTSNATKNIKIDAAILALNHSFTVDRYGCGDHLGDLQVHGAIAQKHRGVVGIVGTTGFNKKYTYDDRLRFRTPPKFLDPVNTAWHVARQVEQSPAT